MYFLIFILYIIIFVNRLLNIIDQSIRGHVTNFNSIHYRNNDDTSNNIINNIIEYDTLNMKKCNGSIVKLNDNDQQTSCDTICGKNYIKKNISVNNYGLTNGTYCVPNNFNYCHAYTGILVRDYNQWNCISKFPTIFGGPNANTIVSCHGSIIEYTINGTDEDYILHVNKIPDDLIITENPESEKITAYDGTQKFRFSCAPKRDYMENKYITTDISRFHLIQNKCSRFVVRETGDSYPDFHTGHCKCKTGFEYQYDGTYCAPSSSVYNANPSDTRVNFTMPCMKLNMPYNDDWFPCDHTRIRSQNASAFSNYELLLSPVNISNNARTLLEKPY